VLFQLKLIECLIKHLDCHFKLPSCLCKYQYVILYCSPFVKLGLILYSVKESNLKVGKVSKACNFGLLRLVIAAIPPV